MLDIIELYKRRKSNTAVFLGSGRSINEITTGMWKAINQCDIWTVNNWVYHPFIVPDFYHIEVKHYNYRLIQKRLKEKRNKYHSVNFIFPQGKTIKIPVEDVRLPLNCVAPRNCGKVFEYDIVARDPKRTDKRFHAHYNMDPSHITKSYDMSVTAVFEIMYRMGYERIITFGIDLQDSYYFWTGGDPRYGEVHHQSNKAHENKSPQTPHATHRIKDFLVDFDQWWFKDPHQHHGDKPRDGIYVGHKTTALYPEISFKSVLEL